LLSFCRRAGRRLSRVMCRGFGGACRLLPWVARRELVSRLCRETLGRDPGAEDFARWAPRWKTGGLSQEQLREVMRNGPEYQQVVKPLTAEIKAVYAKFLLREPTHSEVARHVGHFRAEYDTPEECARAVRGGDIRKHLGIRPLKLEIDITNKCNLR